LLKKIEPDKWKHFFVGIVMGVVLQAFIRFLLPGHLLLASALTLLLVIVISYGFEVFSKLTGYGHYDFIDAVAGVLGGSLGMVIVLFFQI
jgi:glycopeptide antibiotics resistance protein